MIRLDQIALGAAPPDDVNVLVTVPPGSEPFDVRVDDVSGALIVSELYHSAMRTPGNIGLIPRTASETADPLPAIVMTSHALSPGMVVSTRPLGVLYVAGELADEVVILAVPAARLSRRYAAMRNYTDVPQHQLREIAHFFTHYREVEDLRTGRSAGWGDVNEARRVVLEAAERARQGVVINR